MTFRSLIGLVAIALILAFLSPQSARADWHRATTDHFVVYGEGSARSVAEEAEQLERLDRLMRQTFRMEPQPEGRKLPVYLVRNHAELKQVNPSLPPSSRGFYQASPFGIAATLVTGESNHILFHEYAHHFMYQNFPGHYPRWFVEGFAEYFATADVRQANRVRLGYFSAGRMQELSQGRWIDMELLLSSDNRNLTTHQRYSFYALSWLLTHYMISDPDRLKALGGYLDDHRKGIGWQEALQTHFGMTPEDLRKALRSYLNGQMRYGEFSMEAVKIQPVTAPLPASADRFILAHAALQRPMTPERAQVWRDQLTPRLAAYGEDALGLATLAQLSLILKDEATTEAYLTRLLALDPNHMDGVRIMAQLRIDQANDTDDTAERTRLFREAQAQLVRGMQTDPTDFRIYRLLAMIRQQADTYPTENDINTLVTALSLAPQVIGLRMQTVDALKRAGREAEAEVLLKVLASQSHATDRAPEEPDPKPEEPRPDDEKTRPLN